MRSYQMDARPRIGEHVAWAESNAIVFANAVLGARTHRYGDFLDIAAAITGRAPAAGLHLDTARHATIVFDVSAVPANLLDLDVAYPVIGHHIGKLVGSAVPVIVGAPAGLSEDRLKAIGSAGHRRARWPCSTSSARHPKHPTSKPHAVAESRPTAT